MRHPLLQRIASLVLLVGTLASLLPFGHEALAEERWNLWTEAVRPDGPHASADVARAPAPAESPDGLTPRDDPRPAYVPATVPAGPSGAAAAPLLGLTSHTPLPDASLTHAGEVGPGIVPVGTDAFGTSIAPRAP